ncbi:hypothetical protein ELQ39_15795 [Streptomyces sp. GB4-14]|uniref:hypothetical protein n=1 Tax=Streptomyces sp. GB4-14 TaxID=2498703 RepID=UPI001F5F88D1|nr:hypothetical protein [Streptomyces sp. GB4-14]
MTYIRGDVRELLLAGHTNAEIARRLGVDPSTPARARTVLGLPQPKPGRRPAATAEDLFWRRVKPVGDHMVWTGYRNNSGAPSLRHGGRTLSAYRIAYRIATGREPDGYALPSCGREGCVKPGHHADRTDRAEARKVDQLYSAIFGGAA